LNTRFRFLPTRRGEAVVAAKSAGRRAESGLEDGAERLLVLEPTPACDVSITSAARRRDPASTRFGLPAIGDPLSTFQIRSPIMTVAVQFLQ
jgi:hypothetical protein